MATSVPTDVRQENIKGVNQARIWVIREFALAKVCETDTLARALMCPLGWIWICHEPYFCSWTGKG